MAERVIGQVLLLGSQLVAGIVRATGLGFGNRFQHARRKHADIRLKHHGIMVARNLDNFQTRREGGPLIVGEDVLLFAADPVAASHFPTAVKGWAVKYDAPVVPALKLVDADCAPEGRFDCRIVE